MPFARPTVGLDIGVDAVRAAVLETTDTGWSLAAAGEAPLAADADDRRDVAAAGFAVRALLRSLGIRRADVVTAVSGHAVIVKRLALPAMSAAELAERVPWEAARHVPFDLSEVRVDYHLVPSAPADGRSTLDVLLVAARRDRIAELIEVVAVAGYRPAVVDIEAFALANAYRLNYADRADALTALVHVGRRTTVVCVLSHGEAVFARDVASSVEAEGEQVAAAQLAAEVRSTIDFYATAVPGRKTDRALLSGAGRIENDLRDLLEVELATPVEVFNPLRGVDDIARPTGEAIASAYAVAVGLAMRRRGDR
jgi:type IV pilus assembly protein PilM